MTVERASANADLADAQRELDAACEAAGGTLGCVRTGGELTAPALRAIARSIRQVTADTPHDQ